MLEVQGESRQGPEILEDIELCRRNKQFTKYLNISEYFKSGRQKHHTALVHFYVFPVIYLFLWLKKGY